MISRHTTVLQKENHTNVLRHSASNISGSQEWRLRETSTQNRSLFKWTVRLPLNYFPMLSEKCHRSWTKSPLYIYRVLFFIIGRENVIKKKKKRFSDSIKKHTWPTSVRGMETDAHPLVTSLLIAQHQCREARPCILGKNVLKMPNYSGAKVELGSVKDRSS